MRFKTNITAHRGITTHGFQIKDLTKKPVDHVVLFGYFSHYYVLKMYLFCIIPELEFFCESMSNVYYTNNYKTIILNSCDFEKMI